MTLPVTFDDTVALLLATTYPDASKILVAEESDICSDLTVKVVTSLSSSSDKNSHQKKPTSTTATPSSKSLLGLSDSEGSADLSIFRLFRRFSLSLIGFNLF